MSINVNVSGNPVSIRRGKMFMSDIESFKNKETQRRRRARLDQVREQSKDFASDVRSNYRNETSSLLSDYEKTQSENLKRWSTKKLLHLQQQYDDCLENLGAAHALALQESSPTRVLSEQRQHNSKKASERGHKAVKKMKAVSKQSLEKEQLPKCRKIQNRRLENVRSKLVSQYNQNSPSKRRRNLNGRSPIKIKPKCGCKSANTECVCSTEDYDPSRYQSTREASEISVSVHSEGMEPPREAIGEETNFRQDIPFHSTGIQSNNNMQEMSSGLRATAGGSMPRIETDFRSSVVMPEYIPFIPPPEDTRLSDLIKRRNYNYYEPVKEYNPQDYQPTKFVDVEPAKKSPAKSNSPIKSYESQFQRMQNEYKAHAATVCEPRSTNPPAAVCEDIIPIHPRLEFTDTTDDGDNLHDSNIRDQNPQFIPNKPISYYDHSNRYSRRYTPRSNLVEKTNKIPLKDTDFEEDTEELRRLEHERDLAAKKRGSIALKKEKIKRDRTVLMKDLANIHKHDQLKNAYTRKKDGHLSEDRLKQKQKVRQRKIEAAFEEVYVHHNPLITLEPVNEDDKIRKCDLPKRSVNVAEWELPTTNVSSNEGTETLKNLLERVAMQRELLQKEISTLGPNESAKTIYRNFDKENDKSSSNQLSKSSKSKVGGKTTSSRGTTRSRGGAGTTLSSNKTSGAGTILSSNKISRRGVEVLVQDNDQVKNLTTDKSEIVIPGGTNSNPNAIQIIIKVDKVTPRQTPRIEEQPKPEKKPSMVSTATSPDPSYFEKQVELKETSTSTSYLSPPSIFTQNPDAPQEVPQPRFLQEVGADPKFIYEVLQPRFNQEGVSLPRYQEGVQQVQHPRYQESGPRVQDISSIQLKLNPPQETVPKKLMKNTLLSRRPAVIDRPISPPELSHQTKQTIDKLLTMSRHSIDNLEVSSSYIGTPDLELFQTSRNLALMSAEDEVLNELFKLSNESEFSSQVLSISGSQNSHPDINELPLSQQHIPLKEGYTALAEFCNQRIDKLTEMIQQVRQDTQKLYMPNTVQSIDDATAQSSYLILPPVQDSSTSIGSQLETSNVSTILKSIIQEPSQKPFRDVLHIEEVQSNVPLESQQLLNSGLNFPPRSDSTVQQTNLHLNDWKGGEPAQSTDPSSSQHSSDSKNVMKSSLSSFSSITSSINSKAGTPMKRSDFAGVQDKELSTILEESKIDNMTREMQSLRVDHHPVNVVFERNPQSNVSIAETPSAPAIIDKSNKSNSELNDTRDDTIDQMVKYLLPDYLSNSSSKADSGNFVSLTSNSSSSSESLDEALKRLGLGWAVTTLRKTQQTLQLSSSSSSSSVITKISLKELLKQQHKNKFKASSTSLNDTAILAEIQKMIDNIPPLSLSQFMSSSSEKEESKTDKKHGRTSTPVCQKNSNLSEMNHSEDISVIYKPSESDSNIQLSVPNISLDISKTLQRFYSQSSKSSSS